MALNSLGPFNFVSFHQPEDRGAPPPLPAQQLEPIQRPGVNGTGFILQGIKGEPFDMRSAVDMYTVAAAANLLYQYQSYVGTRQILVWAGVDFDAAYSCQYQIFRCRPGRIRRITGSTGGLNPGAGAWLEAWWTLVPVFVSPGP